MTDKLERMRRKQRQMGNDKVKEEKPPTLMDKIISKAMAATIPATTPPDAPQAPLAAPEAKPAPPEPKKPPRRRHGLPTDFVWPAGTTLFKERRGEPNLYQAWADVPGIGHFEASCRGSIRVERELAILYLKHTEMGA